MPATQLLTLGFYGKRPVRPQEPVNPFTTTEGREGISLLG
jgi:hypothetical protein